MDDKLFQELVASIREAGEIRRGKKAKEAGKTKISGSDSIDFSSAPSLAGGGRCFPSGYHAVLEINST